MLTLAGGNQVIVGVTLFTVIVTLSVAVLVDGRIAGCESHRELWLPAVSFVQSEVKKGTRDTRPWRQVACR